VGRFAPSPTGSLHLGSLVAALGSHLDARRHGGRWLLRMEDLDQTRNRPGSDAEILSTLEAFALHWDGEVVYQSRRTDAYREALGQLARLGATFECSCSRRELSQTPYPGTCRAGPTRAGPTSTRFRVDPREQIHFQDRLQGEQARSLAALGDVVIRRRDGVSAYQLAVVVDDAAAGVTDVVRGADLLESTAWQIALQRVLRLPTPRYAHLPLVMDPGGGKLSKSRRSLSIAGTARAGSPLAEALCLLQLPPPAELRGAPPVSLLEWAIPRWPPAELRGLREIVTQPPAPVVPLTQERDPVS
jgi:glutamyl-Q tRNA(Asp) synthetase